MDFDTFDQSDKGWRHIRFLDNYQEAADIIIYYIDNKKELNEYQKMVLNHHAGQMLASNNNYFEALKHFKKALYSVPESNKQIKWNAYVNATIAFLDKDMPKLLKYKKELETPPPVDGYYPNLPFVNSFIINFNKTYKEAYERAFNL
ncbi:MAG: hypothetical protein M1480_20205 [Bacteroidetes bacterium]|nr:hypothetical protein [Bacteroidota bacterium]